MLSILVAILCLIIFSFAIKCDRRSVITGLSLNCTVIFALAHVDQMMYISDQLVLAINFIYFILPIIIIFVLAVLEYFRKLKDKSLQRFETGLILKITFILAFVVFYQFIADNNFVWYLDTVLRALNVVLLAFLFIFHSYLLTAFINFINAENKDIDYLLVLGARLNYQNKVSGQLKKRCDTAIDYAKKNPHTKIIMSGAISGNAEISEATGMGEYAIAAGIPSERIILEENAKNTMENIRFSIELIEKDARFAIVSTNYHLQRALLIARRYDIDCIGIPAPTDFRTASLGFVNEIFKYLRRFPFWY